MGDEKVLCWNALQSSARNFKDVAILPRFTVRCFTLSEIWCAGQRWCRSNQIYTCSSCCRTKRMERRHKFVFSTFDRRKYCSFRRTTPAWAVSVPRFPSTQDNRLLRHQSRSPVCTRIPTKSKLNKLDPNASYICCLCICLCICLCLCLR